MLNENEIKQIIIDALYETNLISKEIYEKCHKPHISNLPYDNRTNDLEKLDIRKTEIENRLKENNTKIDELTKKQDTIQTELEEHIGKGISLVDDTTYELNNKFGTLITPYDAYTARGFEKEYNQIRNIIGRIEDNMDALNGDNLSDFFNKNKTILKQSKQLLKDTKELNKIYKYIYKNDEVEHDKLIEQTDIDNITESIQHIQQSIPLIQEYTKNKKTINKIEKENNDYQNEINKID